MYENYNYVGYSAIHFSWFADWKGRRPAFFVSVALVLIFQLAKLGLADNYVGYLIVKVSPNEAHVFFKHIPFYCPS